MRQTGEGMWTAETELPERSEGWDRPRAERPGLGAGMGRNQDSWSRQRQRGAGRGQSKIGVRG